MAPKKCSHCGKPLTQVIVEHEFGYSEEPWETWINDGIRGVKCGHCGGDVTSLVDLMSGDFELDDLDIYEDEDEDL